MFISHHWIRSWYDHCYRGARTVFIPVVLLLMLPAQAQVADAKAEALVEALRLSAPKTGIPNDGLYSDWKIKPDNIARWSKRCSGRELTPTEFESNPLLARQILVCVMGRVLREQFAASNNNEVVAVQRAAAWWMTGDPNQYNIPPTSVYTLKVLESYLRFF